MVLCFLEIHQVILNGEIIDFNNRIICFDTSELEGYLNTISTLIVIDCLVNIVSNNFKNGKRIARGLESQAKKL